VPRGPHAAELPGVPVRLLVRPAASGVFGSLAMSAFAFAVPEASSNWWFTMATNMQTQYGPAVISIDY